MNKLITAEMILEWKCCEGYTEEILQKLCGNKKGLTALEILDLEISPDDKLWVLLRKEILSDKLLRLLAADCAERVLTVFEEKYPEDKRPRLAIEAARKFACGLITREELEEACATSCTAAEAAASTSAYVAAWAASCAATRTTAWAAVRAAAEVVARAAAFAAAREVLGEVERQWQLKRLRELILEMPEEVL